MTEPRNAMETDKRDSTVPADLLRRALKNHDAIAAALRTGMNSTRLIRAIDDMRKLKAEAAELGCYPKAGDVLRTPNGERS